MSDATLLLTALEQGEPRAAEKLLELVYEELRHLAASKMARESQGQTLQPTALVHEAWLRLMGTKTPQFANRAHFFSAAAESMRRILIENARRKLAQRHGGGQERVAVEHPVQAEVVKLRYFAGMTNEETAEALGVSVATVKNYWAFARAWLFQEIKNS